MGHQKLLGEEEGVEHHPFLEEEVEVGHQKLLGEGEGEEHLRAVLGVGVEVEVVERLRGMKMRGEFLHYPERAEGEGEGEVPHPLEWEKEPVA